MPAHDTQAHTAAALALMQTLKRSLDPKNILNRGKVLPVGAQSPAARRPATDGSMTESRPCSTARFGPGSAIRFPRRRQENPCST